MKYVWFLMAIFPAIVTPGCTSSRQTAAVAPVPAYTHDNPVITLKKTPCKGKCPVYDLVIYGDGEAVLNGTANLDKIGKYTLRLSPEQIKALLDAFETANFQQLQDVYDTQVTDVPATYVGLTLNGKTKEVKDRFRAPQNLKTLEATLEAVLTLDGWKRAD